MSHEPDGWKPTRKPYFRVFGNQTFCNVNLLQRVPADHNEVAITEGIFFVYLTLQVAFTKSFPSAELSAQGTYTDLHKVRFNYDRKANHALPKESADFSIPESGNINMHRHIVMQWYGRDIVPPAITHNYREI